MRLHAMETSSPALLRPRPGPRQRPAAPTVTLRSAQELRCRARGPFLFRGGEKLVVRGVTYGTFAADEDGALFPPRDRVIADFQAMCDAGVTTVRTYTPPPNWLLDEARATGLLVLVGIYWDGNDCIFDDPATERGAEAAVRAAVSRCKHYPDVVLGYTIGNEIPPLVTRLHGARVIERFLRRLYEAAKAEDPLALVSYGNYPSTEFLQLEFLDFHTLNVYLLEREPLAAYLDRALIQAQGKPLLLGEIGDDSLRKGEEWQAELLDWTIPLVLEKGCAGLCVFSWTDEWVVGGQAIDDWDFGLVDRARRPKRALEVVRCRYRESRLTSRSTPWPRVSVIVCNYNGADTLQETLQSLLELAYPDYEVIYVDDGSTDESLAIARRHEGRIRIIAQDNRGLSAARNRGAEAADGEIVAYIDSDAYADPDWLRQLVLALESGDYAGVGGPNLTPESDGLVAQFIAQCPGNPTHVLTDNVEADHIAGVNMAFRRDALLSIGGFDPVHRKAGDDVDLCWRLEDAGMKLAFSPAAIVWHHRRPSIKRYLQQQYGYGEAENQLERKHPERFNLGGYIRWGGRVYLGATRPSALFRPFVYHGRFGDALFQTLYQKDPSVFLFGPTMIHWYLAWAVLIALAPLSSWLPVIGGLMLLASLWVALIAGVTKQVPMHLSRRRRLQKTWTIATLHFVHPVVRWYGRIFPKRRRAERAVEPKPEVRLPRFARARELRTLVAGRKKELRRFWGIEPAKREEMVRQVHAALKARRLSVVFGQEWSNYDLCVVGPLIAEGRVYSAPEHYGQALCWGFLCRSKRWLVLGLLASSVVATAGALFDVRLAAGFVVPLLLLWVLLGRRARLRHDVWTAIESVMQTQNATRYERDVA